MKLIPRGRTAKLVFLGLMVMAIATVGSYFAYYRLTHRPITFLPPVQAVTKRVPPRYVTSIYGVQAPLGVAAAGSRIYVAESKGDAIVRIFDTSGNEIGTLETPNVSSLDRRPCYVAVDSGGQVYVSDCRRLTVDMFSPQGQYVGALLPNGDVGYVWQPLALAFGPQGQGAGHRGGAVGRLDDPRPVPLQECGAGVRRAEVYSKYKRSRHKVCLI